MDEQRGYVPPFLRRILVKRWVKICCALLVLFLLFLFLLPHAIRVGLEHWLINNGADQADVDKIELNLFTGSASLKGVNVTLDGKTVQANSNITFNLGTGSLLKRHTLIQSASLNNVVLDIEHYADGRWRFGSFTTQKPKETVTEPEKTNQPWLFRVQQLDLVDCTIHYRQPDLNLKLYIEKGHMVKFTTGPTEMPAELSLKGSLNNAPLLVQIDTLGLYPTFSLGGSITTSGIQLDRLAELLQDYVNPFSGVASADGAFKISLPEDRKMLVDYIGSIELDQGDIGGAAYSVKGKSTSWKGTVTYQQDNWKTFHINLDGTLSGSDTFVDLPGPKLHLQEKMLQLEGKTSITIADEISVNSDAAIRSQAFALNMLPYTLSDHGTSWQGTVEYRSGTSPFSLHVATSGKFIWSKPSFAIEDESLSIAIENPSASWDGQVEYAIDQSSQKQSLQTSGTLNLDGTEIDSNSFFSAGKGLYWEGTARYSGGDDPGKIELNGSMEGSQLQTKLKETGLQAVLNSAEITTQSTVTMGDSILFHGQGSLLTTGLQVINPENDTELASYDQFTLNKIEARDNSSFVIESVGIDQLMLTEPGQQTLQVRVPEILFSGIESADLKSFKVGNLTILEPVMTDLRHNRKLVEIDQVEVENVLVDQVNTFSADLAMLHNLTVLPGDSESRTDSFLHAGSINLNSPAWTKDKVVRSESITGNDLQVHVVRDTDGSLLVGKELKSITGQKDNSGENTKKPAAIDEDSQPAPSVEKETETSPGFRVETLEITGNSALTFTDNSLAYPFSTRYLLSSFTVNGIDSKNTDKPASYTIEGKLDQYAVLSMQGEVNPFSEQIFLTMNRTIKNYPLINLGPYSKQYLGIVPSMGSLYTDSMLKVDQGDLVLEETLLLKKLEIKTVDNDLSSKLDSQLPLPLNAALSMLRDKDDNISLPVSMSGPVDDLDFGISGIFITPLSKAIVTGASTYFTYALGPYGALAYVGMKVGEKILQTRLPPVEFDPGKNILQEKQHEYLARVAELMQNRPKIDLQLCAQVAGSEIVTQGEKPQQETPVKELSQEEKNTLVQLGHSRALAIKDYLNQHHNVDPARLLICLPALDEKANAIPRVELQL